MEQLALLGVRLRAAATFEQFETGTNAAVVAACEARTRERGLAPALIWGVGCSGRSHLLQAICARATSRGRSVAYLPLAEPWCQPGMLVGLDKLDVLCLDDVDARLDDPDWARALFNLYNDILDVGGNLILTTGCAPAGLTVALPDLASRLAACLILQVRVLDAEAQGRALKMRAQALGIELPDDVFAYLYHRLPRDLGTLLDALDRLDAASLSHQRRLTVPFVRSVLSLLDD
ncbi:MAG: DnaA regulatory inactivator Hda [Pseudomonadota bacterium]|jgi:DnaA family protein